MIQEYFDTFLKALFCATANMGETYFKLPVAYDQKFVFRERVYCYELYHQIRQFIPIDYPYILNGEIDKLGHPQISSNCGSLKPDFLVHNPGKMASVDNLVIVEVKTIQNAKFTQKGKSLLKDMETINCMTSFENGYYRGIILIFGSDNESKKKKIIEVYKKKCNLEKVLLLFHGNAMQRAISIN